VLGDSGPMVDAELIVLAHRFFAEAGIQDAVAYLNSIGDENCRPGYRQARIDNFAPHRDRLTDDSRRRLQVNPLRVLDDKQLDSELAAEAPRSVDHLCADCAEHFRQVLRMLDALGLRYEVDPTIVRGLDYYTRTTFEFFVAGRRGQQQSLAGGGRYDGLAELLGGRPTPGIGFGLGIDRAVLAAQEMGVAAESPQTVAVVSADPDALEPRLRVAGVLREAGLRVRPDGSARKLGRQLESAAKVGARWAVIVGEELGRGEVVLRDMSSGEQRDLPLTEVAAAIDRP
jgi:histidyl-tRNA synthetase